MELENIILSKMAEAKGGKERLRFFVHDSDL